MMKHVCLNNSMMGMPMMDRMSIFFVMPIPCEVRLCA